MADITNAESVASSVDLTSRYMGLELANPIVASASPITGSVDTLLAVQEAGVGAVVLPSLFEEQVEHEIAEFRGRLTFGADFNPEAHDGYFPDLDSYNTGADEYLDVLVQAKRELSIPVIASLNGTSEGGWTHYALALQDEGADALELNIYYVAADPDDNSFDVEDRYLRLVEQVRTEVEIPLSVKIGPFFSSMANIAQRFQNAGADALVLFNRFYQPDIDLDQLKVVPDIVLSEPVAMRLALRWIAILSAQLDIGLAATGGVHDGLAAAKLILAGADATMMASALLRNGPEHAAVVLRQMTDWFEANGYESIEQAKGSVNQASVPDPSEFERVNYMKAITSY